MNYLHVAIIEDYEECLISNSEDGLRKQVDDYLTARSIVPPTDSEWMVCVLAKVEDEIETDNLALGLITYYKTESKLAIA